jgi:hypothetical protein
MTKYVRFAGRRHNGAIDSIDTPPMVGIWQPGDVRCFDARLAFELGRACGPTCEGDCWAEFFVATQNINADHNAPWFEIVPEPVTADTTPETAAAPDHSAHTAHTKAS